MTQPTDGPVFEFTSHISGKNAKVRLYEAPARIELDWPGRLTATRVVAVAALVAGRKGATTDTIPVGSVSGVSTKKKMMHTILTVRTPSGVIEAKLSHDEADQIKRKILELQAAG